MGLGRIKGNPFSLEVWCQNKKYVAAMLILDHVSITLQCNHKRVFISMVYKTADSRKWFFICYLCLQFLLCFDKEGVLLDLKLYIYQLCCSYLFLVCFLLRIFYGHPKDFIIMVLSFVFCIVLVMRKIKSFAFNISKNFSKNKNCFRGLQHVLWWCKYFFFVLKCCTVIVQTPIK